MKNLTAPLKSLILTATLASLAGCASSNPYQSQSIQLPAVSSKYSSAGITLYAVENLFNTAVYGLDRSQKEKQTAAVYAALNGEYGDRFEWYDRDAKGSVKAVHGYPQGSGFCKVVYSLITVKGRSKHFEETACRKVGYEGWRFKSR